MWESRVWHQSEGKAVGTKARATTFAFLAPAGGFGSQWSCETGTLQPLGEYG